MLQTLVLDRVQGRLDDLNNRHMPALALTWPGGRRIGPTDAQVHLRLRSLAPLAWLAAGRVGRAGRSLCRGPARHRWPHARRRRRRPSRWCADPTATGELSRRWPGGASCAAARPLAGAPPGRGRCAPDPAALRRVRRLLRAVAGPAARVLLRLLPRPGLVAGGAQEAKLDHICRKLRLRRAIVSWTSAPAGARLLLWAAEHHGVHGHRHHAVAQPARACAARLIETAACAAACDVRLLDYRDLPEDEPFDKIASIGMFEHVGPRQPAALLRQDAAPAAPGRPAAQPRHHRRRHAQRPARRRHRRFIERYIFPGGELLHVSHVLRVLAEAGLEGLDTENLRPHYARTLWAWSDALESQLDEATRARRRAPRCAPTACTWPAARWPSSAAGWRCTRPWPRGPAATRRMAADAWRTIGLSRSTATT